ncbi:unnamed protein product [Coregonus sp. 'balchen']|nr:unnamed protein product [Coregonus sp. 'balchen']
MYKLKLHHGRGAGRRLKGPEHDTVDDSICEEPSEFIEGERPRPQGSSPVDEYPETDKYTDIDKQGGGGSGKKGKRGFGSLFEKRSPAKMSKLERPESGVIVKMAKETCAEGLVLSGGGKEGIFIKEVRPESPASKLLSVHEGDQILSATVYFDDVKYEDALQILEHAQPYKMELLLKRKPIKTSTLESEPALEFTQVEEGSSLEMRGHSKPKRHGDRISWPKFPSFSKSRKSHFKRSHSTSDADDQRKLELSPTTSDTESPIKSQEAVKGRTKKHKIKLSSVKMKGRKSRSVEQPDQDTDILTVECVQVMEIQQSQDDIYSPDGLESTSGETPQVYVLESESEKMESTKIKNECTLPDLTGSETKKHKVELIRLDKTLKTTDLTVAFADQESPSTKKSPEGKKMKKENKERSELKFRFKGNEKKDKHKQDIPVKSSPKSTKTPGAFIITSDLSAHDNTLLSPTVVSHTKLKERQLPIDINTRLICNESSGKTLPSTDMEMSIPKVAISLDMSDIGLIRKSPQIGQEQDLKETYVKTNLNAQEMLAKVTSFTMEPDLQMEIQALKLPTETSIDDVLVQIGTRTATKFKLPRMDHADFVTDKPIKMTDVKIVEMDVKSLTVEDKGFKILPNRDDIEIPGMEDASSTGTKTPVIKQPKTAFTLPVEEIQAQTVQMVIDVDRVKEAVSKLPGFKLPKGDIAGLPAHQEITKTYVNAERVNVTVDATLSKITDIKAQLDTYVKKTDINASTEKLSMSSVTTIKLPKNQLSDLGAHEPITMTEIDHTKTKEEAGRTNEVEIKIELHKREDVEIPGMETIQQKGSPNQVENKKETGKILEPKLAGPVPEWPTITAEEKSVIPYTKGLDKKSKKAKTSMPGFGKTQLDIRLQDIGIGLPKRDTSAQKEDEVKDESTALHLEMKMPEAEIKLSKEPDSEYSIIKVKTPETDLQTSTIGTLTSGKMAEVPSVDIKGAGMDIDVQAVDVGRFKMPTLKFPKFEAASPNVTLEVPYVEKDIKVHGTEIPEPKLTISAINIEKPSVDLTGPSVDVYVNSKKREIVTLPEVKVEVQPTSVELKVPSGEFEIPEEAATEVDLKMKKPRLSFGWFSKPEAKAPEVDVSLTKVDILLPEGKVEVKEPDVEIKAPEVQIGIKHDIELEGQGRTFKLTTFGLSLPKVKGPEIGLSLSKTDVDVDLPEGRADLQLPDVEVGVASVEVEIPESGSKDIDVKMKKATNVIPQIWIFKTRSEST